MFLFRHRIQTLRPRRPPPMALPPVPVPCLPSGDLSPVAPPPTHHGGNAFSWWSTASIQSLADLYSPVSQWVRWMEPKKVARNPRVHILVQMHLWGLHGWCCGICAWNDDKLELSFSPQESKFWAFSGLLERWWQFLVYLPGGLDQWTEGNLKCSSISFSHCKRFSGELTITARI